MTFMDGVILGTRLSHKFCDSGENERADNKVCDNKVFNKESIFAPISGYHCCYCSFPRHCKRSEFLRDRFVCTCDVDVIIEERSYRKMADSMGLKKALPESEVNELQLNGIVMKESPYRRTSLQVSTDENINDALVESENQRRIDQLNQALARSKRLFTKSREAENSNNSSSANFYNNLWESASGDVALNPSPRTQNQRLLRDHTDSWLFCSHGQPLPTHPLYMFNSYRPAIFIDRRSHSLPSQRRSSFRYQPYRLIRRQPHNGGNATHRYIQKSSNAMSKSAKHFCFTQGVGFHLKENDPLYSGTHGRLFQGASAEVRGGSGHYRQRTCRGNYHRKVVISPRHLGINRARLQAHWSSHPYGTACGSHHKENSNRESHSRKGNGGTCRRKLYARFRGNMCQNGDFMWRDSTATPACPNFVGRPHPNSVGGTINFSMADPSGRKVEPGYEENDTLNQFEGKNNSCSMDPMKVKSSCCGHELPVRQWNRSMRHSKVDGNSPLRSLGCVSLVANSAEPVFKFSRPLVVLSESKHLMRDFFPSSQSFNYVQKECVCKTIEVNATGENEIEDQTHRGLSKDDIRGLEGNHNVGSKYQTECNGEHPMYPCYIPILNSILKQTGGEVGDNEKVNCHCFSGYPCVIQDHDKDVTSNNNNGALPRPVNNNSCSQQSPHQPYGRTSLGGRVVKVEGDGRCLFRSLVTAEYPPLHITWRDEFGRPVNRELSDLETARADQLRARVVTIMRDNMHFYSQLERGVINADQPMPSNYQMFRDRLRAMSDPSTMPGDLELNAVAMVMERQILVLDTNLAIITSYGHDRFPQSVPVAVRYTRLVADVGHYDAVILNEEPLSDAYGHNETISGRISQAFPIRDATGLCGDFLRLTTSGGNGQSNDTPSNNTSSCPRSRFTGDAKLNAKKEFFYLRDSDKSLHSDGLQPVPSLANKESNKPDMEQRTAEATTSTARATVHWAPVKRSDIRRKRKRRTFSDKYTQTGEDFEKTNDRAGCAKWKKHYYQYRYGLCKPYKVKCSKKHRASVAMVSFTKQARREMRVGKKSNKDQNVNWNSRNRNLKTVGTHLSQKDVEIRSGEESNNKSMRMCSSRFKKLQKCEFTAKAGKALSSKVNIVFENGKAPLTSVQSKVADHYRRWGGVGRYRIPIASPKRKSPTTFINICSPTRHPRPEKPEAPRPQAASPNNKGRRGKSVGAKNRSRRKRAQPVSPGSPHSPIFMPKRPRLPDAFEPAQSRCVLCNNKIEVTARESVKCYMCGQTAHRACVMKEFKGWGQGGGDQNYFICSFCVPL